MSMFYRISMLSPFLEYHFFHFVAFLKRLQHSHVSKLVIDLLNCAEQLLLFIFLIFWPPSLWHWDVSADDVYRTCLDRSPSVILSLKFVSSIVTQIVWVSFVCGCFVFPLWPLGLLVLWRVRAQPKGLGTWKISCRLCGVCGWGRVSCFLFVLGVGGGVVGCRCWGLTSTVFVCHSRIQFSFRAGGPGCHLLVTVYVTLSHSRWLVPHVVVRVLALTWCF